MVWQRLVGSLKLEVSFAEYSLFYRALLQKRPIISRSLLFAATPYPVWIFFVCGRWRRSNSHSDTLFPVIFLVCTPTITWHPIPCHLSCMWQIESLKPVHENMGIFDFLPINVRFCFFLEPSQFSYSLLPMPFHACTASELLYPRVAHVAATHAL